MSAGTYNFTLEQGTNFIRALSLQENGTAMNLTGYSVASQMRSTHDSSTVVGTFTCSVSNATGGTISMLMSASTSGNIEEGMYVYDVEITNSGGTGSIKRILQGTVTVTPEVTR